MKKITALYERTCRPNAENIRRQKNNLKNFAKRYSLENTQHFTDNGYAFSDENRPGFTALMKAIRADEVDTLVTLDFNRLTRDPKAFSKLKKELDQHGVRLISMNEKLNRLPPHTHNADNGLDYELHGEYYFPILLVPEKTKIGKWGLMHESYLRGNHPGQYAHLLLSGKLPTVLDDLDKQAKERWNTIFNEMCKAENVNDALKEMDQFAWIQKVNSIIVRCNEIVETELIFC